MPVQTLRSICLLKVVEEKKKRQDGGFEIPVDIPEEVLMDIRVAELFNGNYEKVSHGRFSDKTTKVTVTYDGVSWTLSTNTLTTSFLGLPPSMKLCKFRLYQNTTVEAKNPFFKIKTLLEVMQEAVEDGGQVPKEEDLVMRLKVQVNTGNWRVGRLVFTGDTFKFVIRINREWRGARSLSHHGVVIVHGETKKKSLFITSHHLEETNNNIKIEGATEQLVEKKGTRTVEEGHGKFENPEKYKSWQIVDDNAVKEFWGQVDRT